jgi:peptidoglycan hydrolase CwlO-like protein
MSYASYEEMEDGVREEFEEKISELESKIEGLEEEVQGMDEEIMDLNNRESDLEHQRDKLQGDLHEAQHFIDWVRDAYPNTIDDYNAVMLIQGDGYGIPKRSSI